MTDWQPTAGREALAARAALYHAIRQFFCDRRVLEVETPLTSAAMNPDPNIDSCLVDGVTENGFLHTSPEFPMKRLLAAGTGPIWQLCRVFRAGETGRLHNPEFSLLEWYRPGFDEYDLMNEVADLLRTQMSELAVSYISFRDVFRQWAGFDPSHISTGALQQATRRRLGWYDDDRETMLDLWLAAVIQPALPPEKLTFITEWPANRATLAALHRTSPEERETARRFEAYWRGMELANGYFELADSAALRRRWETELAARQTAGQMVGPLDERLLAALDHGLPSCAGVALGVDRWLMTLLGVSDIREVIAFPASRA